VISRDAVILIGSAVLHLLNGKVRVRPTWTGKVATFLQMAAIAWVMLQLMFIPLIYIVAAAGFFTFVSGIIYVMDGFRQLGAQGQAGGLLLQRPRVLEVVQGVQGCGQLRLHVGIILLLVEEFLIVFEGGIEHFFEQFTGPMTAWWKVLGSPELTPEVRGKLIPTGIEPAGGSVADFVNFTKMERERLSDLAAKMKITKEK
jgi:hypothetical protein